MNDKLWQSIQENLVGQERYWDGFGAGGAGRLRDRPPVLRAGAIVALGLREVASSIRELAAAVREERRPPDLYGPRGTEIRGSEEPEES